MAAPRHKTAFRKARRHRRQQQHIHAPGDRHLRLARPNTLTGQMHRHQRRRASRINRKTRPLKIEQIGQSISCNAIASAGRCIRIVYRLLPQHNGIVVRTNANKHARFGAAQPLGNMSGIFKRFPHHL